MFVQHELDRICFYKMPVSCKSANHILCTIHCLLSEPA